MTATKRKARPRKRSAPAAVIPSEPALFGGREPANDEPLPLEFKRIADDASAAEGEQRAADAPPPPPPPPPIVDYAGQARDLVSMCAGMLLPFYAELVPVWTQPKQDAVAAALAPVLAKYELQVPDLLAKWAPELGLAIVAIPLAIETRKALRAAAIERKKETKPDKPAPPESPNAPPYHQSPDVRPGRGQVQIVPATDPLSLHTRA